MEVLDLETTLRAFLLGVMAASAAALPRPSLRRLIGEIALVGDETEDVAPTWIILGLLHPGIPPSSRHHVGARVLDAIAPSAAVLDRGGPRVRSAEIASVPVVLAKPEIVMHRSGEAALALLQRNSLPPSRLLEGGEWYLVGHVPLPVFVVGFAILAIPAPLPYALFLRLFAGRGPGEAALFICAGAASGVVPFLFLTRSRGPAAAAIGGALFGLLSALPDAYYSVFSTEKP